MKILLINNDKGWSGGQEHLKDLSGELRKQGVTVHFAVRSESVSETNFRDLGFTVCGLRRRGVGDLVALACLTELLRRERFDIVSVNREHDLLPTVLARRLAFPFGAPGRIMMSYHTATTRKQPLLGGVDGVVCISEHVRTRLLTENPGVTAKTEIIYYGITLGIPPGQEKFDPYRQRRYFTGLGFPLIGMVGDFWKNQIELIEMMPALKMVFPGLKVVFVGDNSDLGLMTPLRDAVDLLKLGDDTIFTGRIPRERIPDVFHDFDLSVTTHRNEGFGIVHLESLTAGTPIVTYDEGGMVDIFRDAEVGRVVSGGPKEFVAAVTELLADDAGRAALGKRGVRLMEEKYSVAAMGARYQDYYRRLLDRQPGRGGV
jgi:glycosyltransferase involved in cell wall biosynthesis